MRLYQLQVNIPLFQIVLVSFFLMSCKATSIQSNSLQEVSQKQSKENLFIIDTIQLKSNVFNNTRRIRVLLPPDYYKNNNKYPVLYLNDGVLVFHAYDIQTIVHELIKSKKIEPIIVVGIDNGASTVESTNPLRDRANEYLPWEDFFETNENAKINNPKGKLYPDFLINEVIPLVNSNFRTKKGYKHTGFGGSSRGALIALYTALKNPKQCSRLLLESPSLYVHNQEILKISRGKNKWPQRVYIGIGTEEGDTFQIKKMAVEDAENLKNIIQNNASKTKVNYLLDNEGKHSFEDFAKRFPKALEFLYGKN
ncbi:alpha/beta hydrolase-fold protein [Yeosuana sp. MJ-SS3]|uniref:Alpha/beta hydrolase-fold protein n=2 Tax=Gilvirhabdus luticola TaxID=3079858 RepID=A0ABU3U9N4_9FLAO|nr:alpha/beta hydrolase-fold protein [Yeosuana sp. MJ-SS3]